LCNKGATAVAVVPARGCKFQAIIKNHRVASVNAVAIRTTMQIPVIPSGPLTISAYVGFL